MGNSAALTSGVNTISSKPQTVSQVDWSVDNEFPADGEELTTPDIAPVIQEIVDQSDWCGTNALTVLLNAQGASSASARRVMAYDDGTGTAPQLVVSYDQSTATGCVAGNAQFQIADSNDNVEEASNGRESTGPGINIPVQLK